MATLKGYLWQFLTRYAIDIFQGRQMLESTMASRATSVIHALQITNEVLSLANNQFIHMRILSTKKRVSFM